MQIIENSKHVLTTFNNVGLGVIFKCGNDYFMKIETVCETKMRFNANHIVQNIYTAVRLKDGKPHDIKECEEVTLVDCKLVIE